MMLFWKPPNQPIKPQNKSIEILKKKKLQKLFVNEFAETKVPRKGNLPKRQYPENSIRLRFSRKDNSPNEKIGRIFFILKLN